MRKIYKSFTFLICSIVKNLGFVGPMCATFFVLFFLSSSFAFAEVRVPFSDVSVKVGKTKRLSTSRSGTFLMAGSGVAQLERDPLTGSLLLRGLREGEAWLYTQAVGSPSTLKIRVRVSAAVHPRTRYKAKIKPGLRRDFQVPGWD